MKKSSVTDSDSAGSVFGVSVLAGSVFGISAFDSAGLSFDAPDSLFRAVRSVKFVSEET